MDRKMIKWEPFNSVISSSKMIKDVLKEKEKIKKPILSEEQLLLINNQILEYFQTKEQVQNGNQPIDEIDRNNASNIKHEEIKENPEGKGKCCIVF